MPALGEEVCKGQLLGGRYFVHAVLARGQHWTALRVFDEDAQQYAFARVLSGDWQRDVGAVDRIRREARLLKALDLKGTIQLLDTGALADGRPFVVEPWIDAAPLASLDRVSIEAAADIVRQLAVVIDAIHRAGMVHRRVRLSKLWLLDNGTVFLSGFGLAAADGTRHQLHSGQDHYSSPFSQGDRHGDLYSLGVLAYRLCVGRFPYDRVSSEALASAKQALSLRPEHAEELTNNALRAALSRALCPLPELAYESADEFAQELTRIVGPADKTPGLAASAERLVRARPTLPAIATLPPPAFVPEEAHERANERTEENANAPRPASPQRSGNPVADSLAPMSFESAHTGQPRWARVMAVTAVAASLGLVAWSSGVIPKAKDAMQTLSAEPGKTTSLSRTSLSQKPMEVASNSLPATELVEAKTAVAVTPEPVAVPNHAMRVAEAAPSPSDTPSTNRVLRPPPESEVARAAPCTPAGMIKLASARAAERKALWWRAQWEYEQGLVECPSDAQSWLRLGKVYERTGDLFAATRAYEHVTELEGSSTEQRQLAEVELALVNAKLAKRMR